MQTYEFRQGNGNDGNYFETLVELAEDQCPYAALKALVVNLFSIGTKTRAYVSKLASVEGEADYGLYVTILEGTKAETEFGAAWFTAELRPVEDAAVYNATAYPLKDLLDRGAWQVFKRS